MKGLLLQDFYLMKKNLTITGFVCAYFLLILLIGSNNSTSSDINFFIYGLCGIIPCFLTSCACFTMNSNKSAKSQIFIYTYPVSNTTITLEKYIMTYILLISGYVIISIFVLLNHFLNSYNPDRNTFYICFLIFSILFLFLNLQLPIILRFGQAVASGVLVAVLCFGIIFALTAFVKIAMTPDLYEKITLFLHKKFYIGILVILIDLLSMIGSFSVSKKLRQL